MSLPLVPDRPDEPAARVPTAATCALPHWGVLHAEGADAASFLQSQLTQDVSGLAIGTEARLAGYCSAKGRLLASFIVWRDGHESFQLACSADVLAATLKRLSMFVLRAKCKLSDASTSLPLWGLAGEAAAGQPFAWPDAAWRIAGSVLRLPDAAGTPRGLWLAGSAPPLPVTLERAQWDALEVASAVARIVAATSEQFVPQMINFEAVGGVSFRKGCYPGQEVVARSQYRGAVKRRAFVFDSPEPAQPGQELVAADDPGQPAGMVVNAASHDGRHLLLAEVKLAALAGAALHLGSIDGAPLRRVALPYELPAPE